LKSSVVVGDRLEVA